MIKQFINMILILILSVNVLSCKNSQSLFEAETKASASKQKNFVPSKLTSKMKILNNRMTTDKTLVSDKCLLTFNKNFSGLSKLDKTQKASLIASDLHTYCSYAGTPTLNDNLTHSSFTLIDSENKSELSLVNGIFLNNLKNKILTVIRDLRRAADNYSQLAGTGADISVGGQFWVIDAGVGLQILFFRTESSESSESSLQSEKDFLKSHELVLYAHAGGGVGIGAPSVGGNIWFIKTVNCQKSSYSGGFFGLDTGSTSMAQGFNGAGLASDVMYGFDSDGKKQYSDSNKASEYNIFNSIKSNFESCSGMAIAPFTVSTSGISANTATFKELTYFLKNLASGSIGNAPTGMADGLITRLYTNSTSLSAAYRMFFGGGIPVAVYSGLFLNYSEYALLGSITLSDFFDSFDTANLVSEAGSPAKTDKLVKFAKFVDTLNTVPANWVK